MQNGIRMLAPSAIKTPHSTINHRSVKPFSMKPSARDSCTFAGNSNCDYQTLDDTQGRLPKISRSNNQRLASREDCASFTHVDKSLTLSFQPD